MHQFNLHREIVSDRLKSPNFLYQCGQVMFAVTAVVLTAANPIESAVAKELEVIDLHTSATSHNTNLRERLRTERKSREFISRLRSLRDNPHTSKTNLVITEIPHRNILTSQANNQSNFASELRGESLPLQTTHRNTSDKSTGIIGNWKQVNRTSIFTGLDNNSQNQQVKTNLFQSLPQNTLVSQKKNSLISQATSREEVDKVLNELRSIKDTEIPPFFYPPGLSIYIPTGFGGDRNRGFIGTSYQTRGRFSNDDDFGLGLGVGLGDARKTVGVEISYTLASWGRNRDFGTGGFNLKVHRQLADDLGIAVGWNGFLNIGDENNFEQSLYGVVTKIFRTQENIEKPFSRVAVTLGVGTGQFRTEDAVFDGDNNVNVFGNVAIRVAKPASLVVEWTGQDLGVGVSVTPFANLPLVITPAVRDITGAGDGARFVIGTSFSFQF